MKSGNLNFLESSGPLQACNGTALPLPLPSSMRGRDRSVGTATRYGLDGPGIESRWIFRNHPDRPWGPTSRLYNGYRVFLEGKAAGA